jgi:2-C-methyl-D-erythritol 4-phosphate cytidylyltransferase
VEVLLASACRPVVCVVPEEHLERAAVVLGGSDDVVLVAGGSTRQQSVYNGLERIDSGRVVVHDAARPFVVVQSVQRVLDALAHADGAVTAVAVEETIKKVRAGMVEATIDRTALFRIQTPQAFHTPVLTRAHQMALAEGFEATDDAQLVERYGGKVAVVKGSRTNIKLTFEEDFELAEAILGARR